MGGCEWWDERGEDDGATVPPSRGGWGASGASGTHTHTETCSLSAVAAISGAPPHCVDTAIISQYCSYCIRLPVSHLTQSTSWALPKRCSPRPCIHRARQRRMATPRGPARPRWSLPRPTEWYRQWLSASTSCRRPLQRISASGGPALGRSLCGIGCASEWLERHFLKYGQSHVECGPSQRSQRASAMVVVHAARAEAKTALSSSYKGMLSCCAAESHFVGPHRPVHVQH